MELVDDSLSLINNANIIGQDKDFWWWKVDSSYKFMLRSHLPCLAPFEDRLTYC